MEPETSIEEMSEEVEDEDDDTGHRNDSDENYEKIVP